MPSNCLDTNSVTKKEIRVLALGDSYTIGESVDSFERWPVQLADSMNHKGHHFAEPDVIYPAGNFLGRLPYVAAERQRSNK